MEGYLEQKPQAIQLGFVASCIEFVALELKQTYKEVLRTYEACRHTFAICFEFYDVLHTQSREHLTEDLINLQKRREEKLSCQ